MSAFVQVKRHNIDLQTNSTSITYSILFLLSSGLTFSYEPSTTSLVYLSLFMIIRRANRYDSLNALKHSQRAWDTSQQRYYNYDEFVFLKKSETLPRPIIRYADLKHSSHVSKTESLSSLLVSC